jgi:exodeoxyribonuclease V alpha subunit
VEKYLATSVEGIGKSYAKKLVEAFGLSVFDIIENSPKTLFDVPGIGKKRAESICAAYAEKRGIRDVLVFLFSNGLPTAQANKVYEKYKDSAISKIKNNPYLLCKDIRGVGFLTADKFALKLGVPLDSDFRAQAGIDHILTMAAAGGSCGLPIEAVREQTAALLGVEPSRVDSAIELGKLAGSFVEATAAGSSCLFSARIYETEEKLAALLLAKASEHLTIEVKDIDTEIFEAEVDLKITLADSQRAAVKLALTSPLCVITGGPGTGKTTVTRVIVRILEGNGISSILLMAPTGKAANRLAEASGLEASTVHRALEASATGFKVNESNPFRAQFVQCDEYSMSDIFLSTSLLRGVAPGTRVLLVGDKDQLPSVGPGRVLGDIISSKVIPVATLDTIFRQAAGKIVVNAHKINKGIHISPEDDGDDFRFLDYSPPNPNNPQQVETYNKALKDDMLTTIRNLSRAGFDPVKDVQVLAPMKKGFLGTDALNDKLQELLNPNPAASMTRNGQLWKTGDKVMQTRNDYKKEVFNGEIGYVKGVDPQGIKLTVEFNGQLKEYTTSEIDDLTLAYAFTIHKSQGSEFPVVITPMTSSHYVMLRRNLLYTAVTRAKKLFILFGTKYAVNAAVDSDQNEERYTRLKDCLQAGAGSP